MAHAPTRPPKKTITPGAWQEARALIYAHRGRLGLGLALLLVNRLAGLVLPASSKWVIDRVINQHHPELLLPLALAAGGATLVQAITGFGLSQILGVAAQRAITDMRSEEHTSELQSQSNLVCRLLLEKKKQKR